MKPAFTPVPEIHRQVLMPVTIACAAIAGAHWAHQEVLNPPGARQNVAGNRQP